MKKKTTIISEEFDESGKLLCRTTETTEESDDNGYIYPQTMPLVPAWYHPPTYTEWKPTCTNGNPPPITCSTEAADLQDMMERIKSTGKYVPSTQVLETFGEYRLFFYCTNNQHPSECFYYTKCPILPGLKCRNGACREWPDV